VSCIPRHSCIGGIETTHFDLIIQCCDKRTGRESFLFTKWTFKKEFNVVSSEAMVGLCFVQNYPNHADADVLVATDRDKWASMFYDSAIVHYTIDDENKVEETIIILW
jgi:hypothetical protein